MKKFVSYLTLIIMMIPQTIFSQIFLGDAHGRSLELPAGSELSIAKQFSPTDKISIDKISSHIVKKFIDYMALCSHITNRPYYPADAVASLSKRIEATDDRETLQLLEMAHLFEAPVLAYALSGIYLATKLSEHQRATVFTSGYRLNQIAEETLRKHYFLLTGDKSVMHYKNHEGDDAVIMLTLHEVIHVKRIEVENSRFDLSGHFLCSVEGLQVPIQAVDSLDLSDNFLTELPENFGMKSSLKKLNLSNNLLSTLPESLGNLTQLEVLDVSNNLLETLPEAIGHMKNLWRLDAERNQLKSLPDSMCNCSNLNFLNLNNNQLASLPTNLKQLTSLRRLKIDENKFVNK